MVGGLGTLGGPLLDPRHETAEARAHFLDGVLLAAVHEQLAAGAGATQRELWYRLKTLEAERTDERARLADRLPWARRGVWLGGLAALVVVLGAAMIVYTMRGGVSAVIWTDVVQMFIYLGGAVGALSVILYRLPAGALQAIPPEKISLINAGSATSPAATAHDSLSNVSMEMTKT